MAHENQKAETEGEDTTSDHSRRIFDVKKSAAGGLLAGMLTLGTKLAIGGVGAWEAKRLLENLLPTTRFLCSAVMTASATILALLLTLLSVSSASDNRLREDHFIRVKWLARVDVAGFIAATAILMTLLMPIGDSKEIPTHWYSVIYYALVVGNAIIGGLMVTIVLMLYSIISDVVHVVGLGDKDHPLYVNEE